MFKMFAEPIQDGPLRARLQSARAGALVVFEGWVRNHNEGFAVEALEYEAFAEMALLEAEKILAEARERWAIEAIVGAHRTGLLQIGEIAVWVGVSAAHRGEAFAACQYAMDEIKRRLPIWKKEHYRDRPAEWVNCQHCATAPAHHTHHHSATDGARV
ncbi:MAG: molybdenum cofactor biosynthesis protein MoaE [Candidatus Sericytochromatia bacterium]|nr:molybdenum cofactor biosynthesis protein MoaE [Candidatus Sericytochromatia bacterium]